MDRIAGAAIGTLADWLGGDDPAYSPVSDFRGLAAARRHASVTVLDVRRPLEWAAGHIDGALHIALHDLPARLGDLPGRAQAPVWVHCQAGYRAGVAASFLAAAGHQVTVVDDDYGRAAAAGLPVTRDVIDQTGPAGCAGSAARPLRAAG